MGNRWDGKIGKIPGIGDKRTGKRFSPRIPKEEEKSGIHDCRDYPEGGYDPDTGTSSLKEPGVVDLYTPETVSQYKSQWARYERALDLEPSSIKKLAENKYLYKFATCDSITGFWEVEVKLGATYLDITKNTFQILCPKEGPLNAVESDGETFVWEQVRGSRTVEFSDKTVINPGIDILSICREGTGCADGSVEPIVLKVYPTDQEDLFDTITIYTTPTSTNYGNSFSPLFTSDPALKVPCQTLAPAAPPPLYLRRGYLLPTGNNTFTVGWNLPSLSDRLVGTIWQENIAGQYEDVEYFLKGDARIFTAELYTHYRILSVFDTLGNITSSDSCRFYFQNTNKVVLADDYLDGVSFSETKSSITRLPLDRKNLEVVDTFNGGISTSGLKSSIARLPLDKKSIDATPTPDNYDGISWTRLKSTVEKLNLGGMIIR